MVDLESALKAILEQVSLVAKTEVVASSALVGRVAARPIESPVDVPPADNSAMDGYALRQSSTLTAPLTLPVSQYIEPGQGPKPLKQGTAARIFTGAEIPLKANAVVIQEYCISEDSQVHIQKLPAQGANIRRQAQDIAKGEVIISRGTRLQPQHRGLLASAGLTELLVYQPLKIAIIATGNELVEPGKPLTRGHIYNSNQPMLKALCEHIGFKVVASYTLTDDLKTTTETLATAARQADALITCGGISVGDKDCIKQAITLLGSLSLWGIAIKPGKPFAFGHIKTDRGAVPIIGLPGNPVSVFTTFTLVAKPVLLRLQGASYQPPLHRQASAKFHLKPGNRKTFWCSNCVPHDDGFSASLYPHQNSGVLSAVTASNGFVIQEIGQSIKVGDRVSWIAFNDLLSDG